MRDLLDTYAEAKFGKGAAVASMPTRAGLRRFVGGYFPEDNARSERLRALRDAIESSIREEQKLRGKALKATDYAKHRATSTRAGGPAGLGWDIIRAAIPGMSPRAADDEGIEKDAQPPPEPDGRWGPAVHLGAGTLGAALGRQSAMTSPEIMRRVMSRLSGGGRDLPKLFSELTAAGMPSLPSVAGKAVKFTLPTAAKQVVKSPMALSHLRELAHAGSVKIPWKGKAAIGAVALTLPFILYNLWKNRSLRAKGGPESTRAAQQAEHWLGRAEKIRKWRGQQLSQMELAGAPGKYKLLPFTG